MRLRTRATVLASSIAASLAACGGPPAPEPPRPQPSSVTLEAAPPRPAASDAGAAASKGAEADAGEPPCPAPRPGAVREGSAVLNASPDDLPYAPPGPPADRPKLRFDDAKGAPPASAKGAFRLWHDGAVWHLVAMEKGKVGARLQARVAYVSDVTEEAPAPGLRVLREGYASRGRCPDDPPIIDATRVRGGFELTADGKARGVAFKAPTQGCFTVTLRVDGKQELPHVAVGSSGKQPKASKGQDSIEFCP